MSALAVAALIAGLSSPARAGSPACLRGDCPPRFQFINLNLEIGPASNAKAMNNALQVAGSLRLRPPGTPDTAYRWHNHTLQMLHLPGRVVEIHDLGESGVVLGSVYTPGPGATVQPLLWNPDTGEHEILDPPTSFYATSVNDDRLITGLTQDQLSGVRFDPSSGGLDILSLGRPPSMAVGTMGSMSISNAGIIVGQEVVFVPEIAGYLERAYRWTPDDGIEILPLGPSLIAARAVWISERGDIAGTGTDLDFGFRPVIWPIGGAEPIVIPPPQNFFVADGLVINNAATIGVVAPNDLFGFTRAFLWQDGQYIDLTAAAPPEVPGGVARIHGLTDAGDALVEITSGFSITAYGIMRPLPAAPAADLNGDGLVNGLDLGILLINWSIPPGAPGCGGLIPCLPDLNGDGVVNGLDLGVLLGQWTI